MTDATTRDDDDRNIGYNTWPIDVYGVYDRHQYTTVVLSVVAPRSIYRRGRLLDILGISEDCSEAH